jgi:hypothetical protein
MSAHQPHPRGQLPRADQIYGRISRVLVGAAVLMGAFLALTTMLRAL